MDISTSPDHMVSFGRSTGCHVSRTVASVLGLLFVSSVVASGLLVYYYAPVRPTGSIQPEASPLVKENIQSRMTKDITMSNTATILNDTHDSHGSDSSSSSNISSISPDTTNDTHDSHGSDSSSSSNISSISPDTTNDTHDSHGSSGSSSKISDMTTEASIDESYLADETHSELLADETHSRLLEKEQEDMELDIRLPQTLKPIHYTLRLQPFINGNFSIIGFVEIKMVALEPTSNITLHLKDIITYNDTIKLVQDTGNQTVDLPIQSHQYHPKNEFYIAHLESPLEPGLEYTLSMEYQGYLNDVLTGFYRSSYIDDDGNKRLLAVTQFQATHARKAFPCFDEPALKATFEVFLAREENMTSISNMPIADTMPVADQEGWFWDHYNTSVPMSTYLLAFVISDFSYLNSTTDNGTVFRVWARDSAIHQAEYALEIGPSIISYFEEYYQVPYPLPKEDMIALPDFGAGAMENWGLITYRETAMLYDPGVSSPTSKLQIAYTIAHELAHQWFGNIVTPQWWDDIWLNEGFATYVQYLGTDLVEPEWKVMELFIIEKLQYVLSLDSLESSHPISLPVQHPDQIWEIFDAISYNKGSSIIRMMSNFLTEASLRKGLADYLNAFQFDNAVQDDLWHHLTLAAHEDGTLPTELTVKDIMDTWTLQMGYPVIKVTRSPDGTSANVTQTRFLLNPQNTTDVSNHTYMWWVPLNHATQDNPDFSSTSSHTWMNNTEASVTLSSLPSSEKWVIFNIQATGYYRVNYDSNNWKLLVRQLETDHRVIHVINRAQLIDDAMDLARAGHLGYDTALSVFGYLGKETEYIPWKSAINNILYIKSMLERTGALGAFKSYMKEIIVPFYESLGFEDATSDSLMEQFKRKTAVASACDNGHQDCLNNATSLFRQWMQDPNNTSIISPNLKTSVYCYSIQEGGEEEWNFGWNMYLESNLASEKRILLGALGCTKKIWLLSRYLEMAFSLDSGVRKQDSAAVFGSVAYKTVGRSLAWNYLRDNWDKILAYNGGKPHKRLISSVTAGVNTKQQLKEIENFQRQRSDDLNPIKRNMANVIEKTKTNIDWMETHYDSIVTWLNDKGFSTKLRSF